MPITPKGFPESMRVSIVDPSPHNPGTAYVAGNRYQVDDFAPYLYRTTDYGATWTKITDGIPPTEFTRAIREDLVRPGMLYAATERGMWLSYDAGAHWQSLSRNLPPCRCTTSRSVTTTWRSRRTAARSGCWRGGGGGGRGGFGGPPV